jgi:hypothetical protein
VRSGLLSRKAVTVAAVAAIGVLGVAAPAVASGSPAGQAATSASMPPRPGPAVLPRSAEHGRLPAGERYACPAPSQPGQMECLSIIRSRPAAITRELNPAVAKLIAYGFSPSDLRSAYNLTSASASGGGGQTVAIVDAYSDPNAAKDVAKYRSYWGLPACHLGTSAGSCLRIVNEYGNASPLPRASASWSVEQSLDLDMVSAICPRCHIELFESNSSNIGPLGTAENHAVSSGAKFVSNSWSGAEYIGENYDNHYFNHPGVAVDFAAGDNGYGAAYPTDLQYVTSVGGTSLMADDSTRGWSESVWGPGSFTDEGATASGCSAFANQPSWQTQLLSTAKTTEPDGCPNRTENDVAAAADPEFGGAAVYDSYKSGGVNWNQIGGTSEATPIITAIYALNGAPTAGTYPAEYPYLHSSALYDVTSGSDGKCESVRQYLCNGETGYDGPTGLGTPDGTGAFTDGDAHRLTVVDPGAADLPEGSSVHIKVTGVDSQSGATVNYNATGLPSGLSIASVPGSADAMITGTLPPSAGSYTVDVSASDGSATGSAQFTIVDLPPVTGQSKTGLVRLQAGRCLSDGHGTSGSAVTIQNCQSGVHENWSYLATGLPDDAGSLQIASLCLGLSGTKAWVTHCNAGTSQQWEYIGVGVLWNPAAGKCLAVPGTTAGTRVEVASCDPISRQAWSLPAGTISSGVSGLCVTDPGDSRQAGTQVQAAACGTSEADAWTLQSNGTVESHTGRCLSANSSLLSGARILIEPCNGKHASQVWFPGSSGELVNSWSNMCLADPADGVAGTGLIQQDCYGEAGEIWGLS